MPGKEATGNNRRIFVTGGSGLVGSHLIAALIDRGENVTAIYRSDIPSIPPSHKINWIKGDILDVVFLEETLQGFDKIYHCAAMVSFNPKERHAMMHTNVEGTANIVNAALNAGVKKLCYVSSVAAINEKGNEMTTEEMDFNKPSFISSYSKSKYLAEAEVWRAIGEGLDCVIVNPTIVLGSGDWTKGSPQLFKTAYESFPWYSEGTTGFVDVHDVVNAMIELMNSEISGERFILNGDNKTYKELFTTIANAFEKRPPHKKVTPFLAGLIWRVEAIKSMLTSSEPLVTKETASNALKQRMYDSSKLKKFLPSFDYTPFYQTINRVANELRSKYSL